MKETYWRIKVAVGSVLFTILCLAACGGGGGSTDGGNNDNANNDGGDNNVQMTTVSGTVVDVNGVPIIGAEVIISSDAGTVITDDKGYFSAKVEEGRHSIVIRIGSEEIYADIVTSNKDALLSLGLVHAPFAVAFKVTVGDGDYDTGSAVLQTLEGDYIIVGTTYSDVTGDDIYMIKIDSKGKVMWEKTFGEDGSDTGESVYQTLDGGFIIAGSTTSFGEGQDVYLIKTDKDGERQWANHFGGTADEEGKSVQQTADGGYITAGTTSSFGKGQDVYLVKIKANTNGEMEWDNHFGGDDIEWGESVRQTSDGGFIIAGRTLSYGNGPSDAYLIKTDINGNETWQKAFGGTDHDHGESVQQISDETPDGGFIIAGYTSSFETSQDVYLVRTDINGNMKWKRTFGKDNPDRGESVQQTSDGGYIIAGVFASKDVYLIKTDADGDIIWEKTYGGTNNDLGLSVCQTKDGGYIIAGSTNNGTDDDVYIIKVDAYGNSG